MNTSLLKAKHNFFCLPTHHHTHCFSIPRFTHSSFAITDIRKGKTCTSMREKVFSSLRITHIHKNLHHRWHIIEHFIRVVFFCTGKFSFFCNFSRLFGYSVNRIFSRLHNNMCGWWDSNEEVPNDKNFNTNFFSSFIFSQEFHFTRWSDYDDVNSIWTIVKCDKSDFSAKHNFDPFIMFIHNGFSYTIARKWVFLNSVAVIWIQRVREREKMKDRNGREGKLLNLYKVSIH